MTDRQPAKPPVVQNGLLQAIGETSVNYLQAPANSITFTSTNLGLG